VSDTVEMTSKTRKRTFFFKKDQVLKHEFILINMKLYITFILSPLLTAVPSVKLKTNHNTVTTGYAIVIFNLNIICYFLKNTN